MDPDHRDLDQVGRRALDRRVGGGALAERADVEVPVAQLGDVAPPPEDGLDVAVLARERDHRVEVLAHPLEALEVRLDELLRLGVLDLAAGARARARPGRRSSRS